MIRPQLTLGLQVFAFPFSKLLRVPVSPSLQPLEFPLDGNTNLWHIIHSSQVVMACKLAKGTLCSIIQTINQNSEQDWTRY